MELVLRKIDGQIVNKEVAGINNPVPQIGSVMSIEVDDFSFKGEVMMVEHNYSDKVGDSIVVSVCELS